MRKKLLILFIPILFFVLSLLTLNDYGINWDEPIHFHRGQSYYHLLTSGDKTFPKTADKERVSYYESNSLNAEWFLEYGGGHPPMSDIIAASFNHLFYQTLNISTDIHSYHLYNIVISSALLVVIAVFAYEVMGIYGSIIATLTLATYPLFWAESKFNIKDPAEAAFITFTIYSFWKSIKAKNWKWLLISVLSFTLGLGTKFNILFIPLILVPYLVVEYIPQIKKLGVTKVLKSFPRSYWMMLVVAPIIIITLFVLFWPFLWADPIANVLHVKDYYQDIGTGPSDQPRFLLPWKFNAFPSYWILMTTYPYVIVLCLLGVWWSIQAYRSKKNTVGILWVLWLIVPIARVTAPNTSIYGGVRQIMEYIPALALLSGAGALELVTWLKSRARLMMVVILIPFCYLILVLIKLHPNENVYFNSFIGGLSGAAEKDIPYYGNSFGNAYWPLIQWMNENAEPNARLALVQGTALNIPSIMLRPDITRWNVFWSGIDRKGEYLIELTHNGNRIAYPYAWDYVDKYLEPVDQVEIDGVAIAKLWKNDIEHTKKDNLKNEIEVSTVNISSSEDITVELPKVSELSRIVIIFLDTDVCTPVTGSFYTGLTLDTLSKEVEQVPTQQISDVAPIKDGVLTYFFPGREAKYIRFIPDSKRSCIFNETEIIVKVLQ